MAVTRNNVAGIDYSTTSPAICVRVNDKWDIHYLTGKRKTVDEHWHNPFLFFGHDLPTITDKTERYKYISSWVIDVIDSYRREHRYPQIQTIPQGHSCLCYPPHRDKEVRYWKG